VSASGDAIAPLDTGETRHTLNGNILTDLPIEGRNITELIKIMPGMAMNSGLSQYAWNSQLTRSNSGPAGQYVANGTQPGIDDGHLRRRQPARPGNQGTQVANINPDQTAEVTSLTSAYGAEYAKGPVTLQAIGKSGASAFHGALYLYATDFNLDSNDSYWKSLGFSKSKSIPSYCFPGGEIGGPVLIRASASIDSATSCSSTSRRKAWISLKPRDRDLRSHGADAAREFLTAVSGHSRRGIRQRLSRLCGGAGQKRRRRRVSRRNDPESLLNPLRSPMPRPFHRRRGHSRIRPATTSTIC